MIVHLLSRFALYSHLIIHPIPLNRRRLIVNSPLTIPLTHLPHSLKHSALHICILPFSMFLSIAIIPNILLSTRKYVTPLAMKLSPLETTHVLVAIRICDLAHSWELVVYEISLVIVLSVLFITALSFLGPVAEMTLIIWFLPKTLLAITLRYVLSPLAFVMILPLHINQLPVSRRLSIAHLSFIWYSITVYQSTLSIRHTITKKTFVIRSIWKMHPTLSMWCHVQPFPFIHNSQRVDSPGLWRKSSLVNGQLWLVRFHAIQGCLNFLFQLRHGHCRQVSRNVHVAGIVFVELALLLQHIGLVLNLDVLCAAGLAHFYEKLSLNKFLCLQYKKSIIKTDNQ